MHESSQYPEGALTGRLVELAKAWKRCEDSIPARSKILELSSELFLIYRSRFPGGNAIDHLQKQGMDSRWISRLESAAKDIKRDRSRRVPGWKPGMIWLPLYNEATGKGNIALLEISREGEGYTDEHVKEALKSAHDVINRVLVGRNTQGILEPIGKWDAIVTLLDGRDVEDKDLSGNSLALATALAMLSVIKKVLIPQDVAATGSLETSAEGTAIGPVGNVREKWEGAQRELPSLRMFLVPSESPRILSRNICSFKQFEDAAQAVFGKEPFEGMYYGIDPERILAEVDRLHREGNNSRVETMAGEFITAMRRHPHLQKEVWNLSWLRAAAKAHQGRTREALRDFAAVQQMGESLKNNKIISPIEYVSFLNRAYNTLIPDFADFKESERNLRKCIRTARKLQDSGAEGKIHGTLGQLLTFVGRFAEADKELKAALRMVPERERARNYCYLGNLEGRRQRFDASKKYYMKALNENQKASTDPERLTNERFIRAGFAGMGIRSGNWEVAVDQAGKGIEAYSKWLSMGFEPSLNPEIFSFLALHRAAYLGGKRSSKMRSIQDLYEDERTIGKGSYILLLLSRLAGLDLAEAWAVHDKDFRSEAIQAAHDILNVLAGHSGASKWFEEEIVMFKKFVASPDREKRNMIAAIHGMREKMPYL